MDKAERRSKLFNKDKSGGFSLKPTKSGSAPLKAKPSSLHININLTIYSLTLWDKCRICARLSSMSSLCLGFSEISNLFNSDC